MDIRKHLRRWLNASALEAMGGVYIGVIATVTEENVRNGFRMVTQLEPVIVFQDGWRIIPNISARRKLADQLGDDTDLWEGCTVRVSWQRIETDTSSGKKRTVRAKIIDVIAPGRADYGDSPGAMDEALDRLRRP
jgi:hypothetical protein